MNNRIAVIKELLTQLLANVDSGNSVNTDEELDVVIDELTKLNKGIRRLSKAYICEQVLHCSHSTFDKYVAMGLIPKGKKETGFKELSWSEADLKLVKEYRNLNKD